MSSTRVIAARANLVRQVLRLLSDERDEPNPYYADDIDYAHELVALAARDLAQATDALPSDSRPDTWDRTNPADLQIGDWVTVTLRRARVEARLSGDEAQQHLTVGHDAVPEAFPLALTDDTSVTFLATEAQMRAQSTPGGAQ